jgi:hypothetical protein
MPVTMSAPALSALFARFFFSPEEIEAQRQMWNDQIAFITVSGPLIRSNLCRAFQRGCPEMSFSLIRGEVDM